MGRTAARGPATLLLAEAASKAIDAEPIGRLVARRTAPHNFSLLRLSFLLVRVAVMASIVLALLWGAMQNAALSGWVHEHFGPMSNKPLQPANGARDVSEFGVSIGAARG